MRRDPFVWIATVAAVICLAAALADATWLSILAAAIGMPAVFRVWLDTEDQAAELADYRDWPVP